MIKHLDNNNFDTTINDGVTLVDFWATWCGPCRMMNPILETFDETNKLNVEVTKVNVDEQQELARRYSIQSIPTIIIFKDGKPVDTIVGAVNYNTLYQTVENVSK